MKLNDVFTRVVVTCRPDDTLQEVAKLMKGHNVGNVVVVQDHRPVGIMTDRDLALALGADGLAATAPAKSVMTQHVLAIPDATDVHTATRFMRERGVRRLPIVDSQDRLVGMVTLDDLLCYLGNELHNLVVGIAPEMKSK